jgi:hypothetical protein
MNERQKRLIEVYEHLRKYFGIHTKTGFAEALHYGRTSMSAAMNGDEKYLTDSLFKNICDAYPGVFNIDYLLNGEGGLLLTDAPMTEHQPTSNNYMADVIAAKNETIATQKETIAALQREVDMLRLEIERLRLSEFSLMVADNTEPDK